jgi:hypothetical protein
MWEMYGQKASTLENLDHVSEEKARILGRYSLKTDDILFARSGATLGKVCLVPEQSEGWLMSGHLFLEPGVPGRIVTDLGVRQMNLL